MSSAAPADTGPASPAQPGLCPPRSCSPSSARGWPQIFLELRWLPVLQSQALGSRGPERVHSHPAPAGHMPLLPFLDLVMAADSLPGSLWPCPCAAAPSVPSALGVVTRPQDELGRCLGPPARHRRETSRVFYLQFRLKGLVSFSPFSVVPTGRLLRAPVQAPRPLPQPLWEGEREGRLPAPHGTRVRPGRRAGRVC